MLNKIGKILTDNRLITQDQLDYCLEYQKMNRADHLGEILKHHGFIDDYRLADSLAQQIDWKRFKGEYAPDQRAIDTMGLDYFCSHRIFPLRNGGLNPSFVVSFIDNVEATDHLKSVFGSSVDFYIGPESEIRNALDLIVLEQSRLKLMREIEDLKDKGMDALLPWLTSILNLAIIMRSTDIHIEPTGKTTDVRFRIDGQLMPVACLNPEHMPKIANIVLAKCNGNPCDYDIQDGRFYHKFEKMNRMVDVRFSQIPTIYGPSIVLRLLDKSRASIPLESLGYSPHNKNLIDQAIIQPHGLILLAGPTGSGKSTTLSAVLNQIKCISKKIITIEDPVEITHSLMSQVEVRQEQDLTFGMAIRAFLRQDPNIILIGEIRDRETAQECMRAANTGLQIFSTLHTNDPISAILRLGDLGVDAVNIASSLVAVVAQRLIRKLCPFCKVSLSGFRDEFKSHEAKYFLEDMQTIYRAEGCAICRNGYMGRTVVAEVLLIDPEIRELIGKNQLGEIYALLRGRGNYKTMIDDACSLVFKGETSITEAVRVLG